MRDEEFTASTISVDACPACGHTFGEVRHTGVKDRWFEADGSWNFRQCDRCEGLWLDPQPAPSILPRLYANYYTHTEEDRRVRGSSGWRNLRSRLPWHADEKRGAVAYLDGQRPGRVLDVGCGDGSRLARLSLAGWSGTGCDVDEAAVVVARRVTGGDVHIGTIVDIANEGIDGFDAIVMFHVLEHLPDPLAAVARSRELLRPGGVLVIATPNAGSWLHRRYGAGWRGLEPPRHLQIFSAPGLQKIFHDAGFGRYDTFTTARNAASLAFASESLYGTAVSRRVRLVLSLKAELFQAVEWASLRWSPTRGEELVGMAVSDASYVEHAGGDEC
jgi:2-polyprenyl-3-methyl-5-hydroxy-6-metoxy-1,4-benzoquinol methylase